MLLKITHERALDLLLQTGVILRKNRYINEYISHRTNKAYESAFIQRDILTLIFLNICK